MHLQRRLLSAVNNNIYCSVLWIMSLILISVLHLVATVVIISISPSLTLRFASYFSNTRPMAFYEEIRWII